jgi:Xaa-Pro aminopeptidase
MLDPDQDQSVSATTEAGAAGAEVVKTEAQAEPEVVAAEAQAGKPEAKAADGSRPHDIDVSDAFTAFMRTGWGETALEVVTRAEAPHHGRRREQLSAAFTGEALIIPSGRERVRANDTSYQFRPGSDFMWLTGEHDPDAVLIMSPNDGGHDATLYIRPRSPRDTDEFFRNAAYGELWIGRRHTLAEKAAELGIETASLDCLPEALASCPPARTRVLRGYDPTVDAAVLAYDTKEKGARDRELVTKLSELRLVKDEWEVAQLQEAVDITVRGFEDVARHLPADRGIRERLIEGIFGLRARHDGNDLGYSSIVGAGAHATILHWIRNTGVTKPGELLLMDMGVENRKLYTADVTRTVPVNGRFSSVQREVYEIVYRSQQAGIDAVAPGVPYLDVAAACHKVLAEGLYDLKLLPCSVEEALSEDSLVYKRWTLHGFGHMLGLDVHDCTFARKELYRDGSLQEGYVLTVEPGLYFQSDDELVPEELRGTGVRIEDDILVTADGSRNLSAGLPRSADEVEFWLSAQREAGPRLPS